MPLLVRPSRVCAAISGELITRQQKGIIDDDVILLTVEDPKGHVGSGGATLNALLVVAEHISARQGFTVVNSDVLMEARILILHMGRNFPFDPCGRAFVTVPMVRKNCKAASLVCNLDLLLHTLTHKVAVESPPGIWVCSTDMFLSIPEVPEGFSLTGSDVIAISVPGHIDYAMQHGVYKIDQQKHLEDIVYQGTREEILRCSLPSGQVPLVAGLLFFSCAVAERLLSFHVNPPLDSCTYMGIDSGATPLQISLFLDVLLSMCGGVSEEDYVSGKCGSDRKLSTNGADVHTCKAARGHIWKELRAFKVKIEVIPQGVHSYLDMSGITHQGHLLSCPGQDDRVWRSEPVVHSFIYPEVVIHPGSAVINCLIENGAHISADCVISHSHLSTWQIGRGCLISGIPHLDLSDVTVRDDMVLQCLQIHLPTLSVTKSQPVFIMFGKQDDLMAPAGSDDATYCNITWAELKCRTDIRDEDLWEAGLAASDKTLMTAKLFPVFHASEIIQLPDILWLQCLPPGGQDFTSNLHRWRSSWRLSLEEVMCLINTAAHFTCRRELFFKIGQEKIRDTLLGHKRIGLTDLYTSAALQGHSQCFLQTLDNIGVECDSPGVVARTLANIADVLGSMARGRGGLRSGPAGNKEWTKAFRLLEDEDIAKGVRAMARERQNWLGRPDLLVRAARHYEGAAQILIRHAVMTARHFIHTSPCELAPMGKWVTARCPARIDIAGGWSDTPPITYENGGTVINAAIRLDGKKPIGAKVRRIQSPDIMLYMGTDDSREGTRLHLTSLDQFSDYSQPHAPGALVKAAFICAKVIVFPSDTSLSEQLLQKYNGGFELHTWSHLPHGSGLGTSSILAGAVIAVLWRASGKIFDIDSLNHAVLHLEQMLTTGGGWQDQVGGLTGGIKVGHSQPELPLRVDMTFTKISPDTVQAFSDRLVLVYTGKTRLARNLLQNVIRNWYARDPAIAQTQDDLVSNARSCAKAFEQGDLAQVGECMNRYWEQKKRMAPGSEPHTVAQMMQDLRPHTYGVCLAGAGGGGFMYVLTRDPHCRTTVQDVLGKVQLVENICIHDASVDMNGMVMTIEGQGQVPIEISAR